MRKDYVSLVLFFGVMLCISGCTSPVKTLGRTAPDKLRGTWKTDDPKYAEQKFEVTENAIIFHTDADAFVIYSINEIKATEEEQGALFEIAHTGSDGGEMVLSVLVNHGDSTLAFKNQRFRVWRKVVPVP